MRHAFKRLLAAAALALGLGLAISTNTTAVQAAPAASQLNPLKSATPAKTLVEEARFVRRCWRNSRGRLHCRLVWVSPRRHYKKYYAPRHRHYRSYRNYRSYNRRHY